MPDKLYSLKEVHTALGFEGGKELTQAALESLIRESRCFRGFGSVLRMTDQDIADFLKWASPRHEPSAEPLHNECGQIVVIGETLDREGLVYVTWTRRGHELDELERVQAGCAEPVTVLAVWDAYYFEFAESLREWTEAKLRYGRVPGGKWFKAELRDVIKERIEVE